MQPPAPPPAQQPAFGQGRQGLNVSWGAPYMQPMAAAPQVPSLPLSEDVARLLAVSVVQLLDAMTCPRMDQWCSQCEGIFG